METTVSLLWSSGSDWPTHRQELEGRIPGKPPADDDDVDVVVAAVVLTAGVGCGCLLWGCGGREGGVV